MPPNPAETPDDSKPRERDASYALPDKIRFIGESYRLLFERNPLPMWVYDVKTQRFLAVNEAAVQHYGYSRDEFLRLTIRDIRPTEDLAALDRELERLDSGTESFGIWRHRKKDGSLIDVEVLSNEIDFNRHRARLVLVYEITSRLRVERNLRTGYAVSRILDAATSFHDAVPKILRAICEEACWEYGELWRADQDRDALRWDGAWRIVGFPSEDLERASGSIRIQRGLGIPGRTWATGRPEWLTDLTSQAHFSRGDVAARLRIQQALSFPITGRASRVLGVLVFFSRSLGEPDEGFLEMMGDLGNRLGHFLEAERAEAERQRAEERLLESERYASVGRTANFVAHELNTPLTNIALLTASLRRQTQDAALLERLDRIDAQRRLASRIIEEIMTFTHATAIQRSDTDLVDLVRTAADLSAAYQKEGVSLTLDLGERPVRTAVDALKLSQALVNLIKNAYQATDQGRVRISLVAQDQVIRIEVQDTGHGMLPEVRERLFEPFFTTKAHGEGIGLGLSFVRAVVEAHGGQVDVATEPEKGSTFTLALPLSPEA